MTIEELESLVLKYCPPPPPPPGQGRASVTLRRAESNTLCSGAAENNTSLRMSMWGWKPKKTICPVCGRAFEMSYGVHHVYCSNACKQKAYRQRRKAKLQ